VTAVNPRIEHAHGQPSRLDADYWLSNCHGFLVDSSSGEVGVVEDVYQGRRGPRLVVVASGWFGRTLGLVRVEDVTAIYPDQERLVLGRTPAFHAPPPGRVQRLMQRFTSGPLLRRSTRSAG
jgi:hypothetical protein